MLQYLRALPAMPEQIQFIHSSMRELNSFPHSFNKIEICHLPRECVSSRAIFLACYYLFKHWNSLSHTEIAFLKEDNRIRYMPTFRHLSNLFYKTYLLRIRVCRIVLIYSRYVGGPLQKPQMLHGHRHICFCRITTFAADCLKIFFRLLAMNIDNFFNISDTLAHSYVDVNLSKIKPLQKHQVSEYMIEGSVRTSVQRRCLIRRCLCACIGHCEQAPVTHSRTMLNVQRHYPIR